MVMVAARRSQSRSESYGEPRAEDYDPKPADENDAGDADDRKTAAHPKPGDDKIAGHQESDRKGAGHNNDHDDSDQTAAQFRRNREGIEPRADYAELIASNMNVLGDQKFTAGAREEWAEAQAAYQKGEVLTTETKGRGVMGILKSKMRKQVEHIAESFADTSQTLEWDAQRRREAAFHVTDRMLARQLALTEYAEAQAAYKRQDAVSDHPAAGGKVAIDYTQYMTDQQKQTMLDFHAKVMRSMERAADAGDRYSHRDAAKDVANALEKAARYLQDAEIIDKDGNLTDQAALRGEVNSLRQENYNLRQELQEKNAFLESIGYQPGKDPALDDRLQADPTAGEHRDTWKNAWSQSAAHAYEAGYNEVKQLLDGGGGYPEPKEEQRQFYAEKIIGMMADSEQVNEPKTEAGVKFRESVDQAVLGAYELDFYELVAQGSDQNKSDVSGPEAYQDMRNELRETAATFQSMQDQPYKCAFYPDDHSSEGISMLAGDPTYYSKIVGAIEEPGVKKVSEHIIAQAGEYAGQDRYDEAAEQMQALDRIISQYGEAKAEGGKSPAELWKENLAEIKEDYPRQEAPPKAPATDKEEIPA